MTLQGKCALITGGSRGIGAAVAKKLASLGADVAVIYAGNADAAEAVRDFCRGEFKVRAACYQCDVSDFAAAKETVKRVRADFGGIHILVNNAGITRDGLVAMMPERDFDAVLDTNLKGAFNMLRHCAAVFLKQREGRIVNISSVAGLTGNAGQVNYSASKAGVVGLTKAAARELAPKGITCNAVAPGFIDTDMTKALSRDASAFAETIPLGRAGTGEEVAEAVAFLACADYITGAVLRVDGGLAM